MLSGGAIHKQTTFMVVPIYEIAETAGVAYDNYGQNGITDESGRRVHKWLVLFPFFRHNGIK